MLNIAFTRLKKWLTDTRGYFSYNSIHRCQSGSSAAEIQQCYSVPIQSQPPGSPFARQGEVFYLCLNRFLLFPSPLHLYAPAVVLIQHVSRLCYLKCLFSLGLTKKRRRERDGNLFPSRWVYGVRESQRSAVSVCVYTCQSICMLVSVKAAVHAPACACADLLWSLSVGVYVGALWSLGQMTLGNCSLSGDLSLSIIVTKGGVSGSDLFHLPMPPSVSLLMIIMNDLCSTGVCVCLRGTLRRFWACESKTHTLCITNGQIGVRAHTRVSSVNSAFRHGAFFG